MVRRNFRSLTKLALVALLAVVSTMVTLKMMGPSESDGARANSLPFNPNKVQFLRQVAPALTLYFVLKIGYFLQHFEERTRAINIPQHEALKEERVEEQEVVDRPKSGQIDWHNLEQIKADGLRKGNSFIYLLSYF
jgi:hypothetical protein